MTRVIESVLKQHLFQSLDSSFFEGSNQNINKGIKDMTWSRVERLNGPFVTHLSTMLEMGEFKKDEKRDFSDLAEKYILNMSNSRNLYGFDLIKLFKLIQQLLQN